MDINRIEKAAMKYYYIDINPVEAVAMFSNMKALVAFIGMHYPHDRWDIFGDAYFELRKRTNEKLKSASWLYHGKRKTSKSEIRAFICARDTRDPHVKKLRIPYKSYYIMESITECINELVANKVKIPNDLLPLCGELYKEAFMKRQIEKYEAEFRQCNREWEEKDFIAWYLHDDFEAVGSPFNIKFGV